MSEKYSPAVDTLLRCFKELARTMPRAPQLEAIIPEKTDGDICELCVQLAEKFKLHPELRHGVALDELYSHFGSPVLMKLKNDNWIFFLGVRRMQRGAEAIERFAVWDPLGQGKNQVLMLEREKLENYEEVTRQNVGAAFIVRGQLVLTPDAPQPFELKELKIVFLTSIPGSLSTRKEVESRS